MASRDKRTTDRRRPRRPRLPAVEEALPRGVLSSTAVAIEALRTGVLPVRSSRRREEIPHEDETMLMGDPDDRGLDNEYVGDQTPGGHAQTPDQNLIDETGRAYGLQEEDAGELWSAGELLSRRDRHRSELRPSRRKTY
jgi:uncharacterized protein DUF6335